jgi:hypothetical protein
LFHAEPAFLDPEPAFLDAQPSPGFASMARSWVLAPDARRGLSSGRFE